MSICSISVYDVLLPTSPGAQPILLPQPPAYVPTLFAQEHLNVQLLSMPASTYISPLHKVTTTDAADGSEDANEDDSPSNIKETTAPSAIDVFAISSDHCPLVALAPRAKPNELIGGHVVQDAVKERLPYPYLLDASNERKTIAHAPELENVTSEPKDESAETARVEQQSTHPLIRVWTWMWNRWWFWSLMLIVGFSVLLLVFDMRLRKLAAAQTSQLPTGSVDGITQPQSATADLDARDSVLEGKNTVPDDPEKGAMDNAPSRTANGKKSNNRRRRRGKKRSNKDDLDKDQSEEDSDSPLIPVLARNNGKQALARTDPSMAGDDTSLDASTSASKSADTKMEGLNISEEVLGKSALLEDPEGFS
jgi:hypothetical protein